MHAGLKLTPRTRPISRTSTPKKIRNTNTSKCLSPFNSLPLAALRVDELLESDVGSLCRELNGRLRRMSEMMVGRMRLQLLELILRGRGVVVACVSDNPTSDDGAQYEDFIGDGEEIEDVNDTEDVSLDEETNSSLSGDNDQLEAKVDNMIQLGTKIIDNDGDRDLVNNKMARTLRQGIL